MLKSLAIAFVAVLPLAATVGCSTAPSTRADQQSLESSATLKLSDATTADPSLRPVLDRAAGYAVFPNAGRGGLVVGGGYGKGVLYQGGQIVGYCDMSLLSAGAEIGGTEFTEIIVFQTPEALRKFKEGQFAFRADATAVALTAGAAANTQFRDQTAVFVYNQQGLMADASLGAQSFRYSPMEIAQPAGGHLEDSGNFGPYRGSDYH